MSLDCSKPILEQNKNDRITHCQMNVHCYCIYMYYQRTHCLKIIHNISSPIKGGQILSSRIKYCYHTLNLLKWGATAVTCCWIPLSIQYCSLGYATNCWYSFLLLHDESHSKSSLSPKNTSYTRTHKQALNTGLFGLLCTTLTIGPLYMYLTNQYITSLWKYM